MTFDGPTNAVEEARIPALSFNHMVRLQGRMHFPSITMNTSLIKQRALRLGGYLDGLCRQALLEKINRFL